MTEHVVGQSSIELADSREKKRELPVGSELMIAFALGAGGWYAILRIVQWVAG